MKNQIILLAAILVLLIGSCKKEEEFCDDPTDITCPNFDPCTQAVAASSDFKIVGVVESFADTTINIEINEAYGGGNATYKASVAEGLESYTWQVGGDSRLFTGAELYLDFTNYTGSVDVTLETTALNNNMCLNEEQARDVKTKQIFYAARSTVAPVLGDFKGSVLGSGNEQEYEVRIDNSLPPYRRLHGLPLPDDCDFNDRGVPLYLGYQFFVSTFTREGPTPRCRNLTVIGRINLEDRDELRIDYVYDEDDGSRKEVVFVGRRQ